MSRGHTAPAFYIWVLFGLYTQSHTRISSILSYHSPPCFLGQQLTGLITVPSVWNSLPQDINMPCALIPLSPYSNVVLINRTLLTILQNSILYHSIPLVGLYSSPGHSPHSNILLISIFWLVWFYVSFH